MLNNFFKTLFSFNVASAVGVLIGLIFYVSYDGSMPLPPFLFSKDLYGICLFGVAVFHFFLWVFLDKSSFYNIKNRLSDFVVDYVVLMVTMVCSCSVSFLINTFYF